VTHATHAGVYSRSPNRDDENFIAEQLPELELDVAMGGGLTHFIPQSREGSKRKDDKNLVEAMKGKGYKFVSSSADLKSLDPSVTPKLLGLFAMSHMAYELDRQNVPEFKNQPDLAEITKAALSILERNPRGFFVMIEGGRIED